MDWMKRRKEKQKQDIRIYTVCPGNYFSNKKMGGEKNIVLLVPLLSVKSQNVFVF